MVNNLVAMHLSLIPGQGRSSGQGNGDALQYSCLENSTDRGAWWATVHRVTKSQTQEHTFYFIYILSRGSSKPRD